MRFDEFQKNEITTIYQKLSPSAQLESIILRLDTYVWYAREGHTLCSMFLEKTLEYLLLYSAQLNLVVQQTLLNEMENVLTGGLGVHHVRMKAMAWLIRTFLETTCYPQV